MLEPVVTVTNGEFNNNSSVLADGGAIEIVSTTNVGDYLLIGFDNITFNSNQATEGYGGAIYNLRRKRRTSTSINNET